MEMLEIVFQVETTKTGLSASSIAPNGLAILVTASNFSNLKDEIKGAIEFYADGELESVPFVKDIQSGNYVVKYNVSVKDFLNAFTPIVGKSGLEEMTGISGTQFWRYQHSEINPRKKQKQKIESAIKEFGKDLQSINII